MGEGGFSDGVGRNAQIRQGMSETSVHRRRSFLTTTMLAGFAAAACFVVAGCSPGVDFPSIFPAVHDMPPPRADAPMDPDQLQQATEDLITERNHLATQQQQSSGQAGQAKTSASSPTGGAGQPTAKYQPAVAVSAKGAAAGGNAPSAAADGTQTAGTAGTETK